MGSIANAILGAGLGAASQGALLPQFQQFNERNKRQNLLQQINAAGGIGTQQGLSLANQLDPAVAGQLQKNQANQLALQGAQQQQQLQAQSTSRRRQLAAGKLSTKERDKLLIDEAVNNPGQFDELMQVFNLTEPQDIRAFQGSVLNILEASEKRRPEAFNSALEFAKNTGNQALVNEITDAMLLPKDEQDAALKGAFVASLSINERQAAQNIDGKLTDFEKKFNFLTKDLSNREVRDAQRLELNLPTTTTKTAEDLAASVANKKNKFDQSKVIRKEVEIASKEFEKVKAANARINSLDVSAAGDLALIFNFMKMLDPGSVVRESEFATAANAAGVPDRVRNTFNRLLRGERLAEDQRADFLGQAQNLFNAAQDDQIVRLDQFATLGARFGLEREDIIVAPIAQQPSPGLSPEEQAELEELRRRKAQQ